MKLLGTKLEMRYLETNQRHLVNASSENSLMGTGMSKGTEPSSEITRAYLLPPLGATAKMICQ